MRSRKTCRNNNYSKGLPSSRRIYIQQLSSSVTKKRRIDWDTDIAIPPSKRSWISNIPSNTSYNSNSRQTDEDTHNSTDNDSDWETSQASKPRTIMKTTNKCTIKKWAGILVDESDTEVQDPKLKINFRDCPYKISITIKNNLVLCRKRDKNDSKQIIKDIEPVTAEVLANMCWNHTHEFCGGIGLKTKIGGRNQLVQRLEVIRTNRFFLGKFTQSLKYRSWFRQSYWGLSEDDTLGWLKCQPIATPL